MTYNERKSMEARNRYLPDWITRIKNRQIVLPRFQRMEAWGHNEVADLLQTVLDGLPAGAALVLEVGDSVPFRSRPMVGAPEQGDRIAELLLDGQQRLTALWRSLTDNYLRRTFFIRLPDPSETRDDEEEANKPSIFSQGRWKRNGRLYPVWVDSPKECWRRRLIPVRLFRPDSEAEQELYVWAGEAVDNDPIQVIDITKVATPLRQRFAQFNLPFLGLPVGTPKPVTIDVFVKMNTRMVRLTTFDIIVAQIEEAAGESLHDLVNGLSSQVPNLAFYIDPKDIVLPASSLIQNRSPNQRGQMELDFEKVVQDWPQLIQGVERAVRFLEQERVLDRARLPTESVLAPLIALWSIAPEGGDELGNTQILLRRYLWRSFFSERYDRAAATAALQDYRALRDVITGKGDISAVPCLDEARFPLPEIPELVQARWPKYKDRLARALLCLMVRGGAYDIADGAEAIREHLRSREYHHLYPVAHLRDSGIEEEEAYRALNCALITWKTNRTISAKKPLEYLLERSEASDLGEAEIRWRLRTHAIDYDVLSAGDYDNFLNHRAETLLQGIRALADGIPWTPVGEAARG
jgi:hypothetical protein